MNEAWKRNRSRPWGLAVVWALGLTAFVGTCATGLGRAWNRSGSQPSERLSLPVLLQTPDQTIRPLASSARRVDTVATVFSVRDAVETDAGWILLDARSRTVVVLGDGVGPPRTFGRPGEGPGEIRDAGFLAVSDEQVAVLETRGDRLIRFDRGGQVLPTVQLGVEGCPFGPGQALLPAPGGGFVVLRSCTTSDGRARAVLQHVDPGGRTETLADQPLQADNGRRFDPFSIPVAAVLDQRLFLGSLIDGCLRPLAGDPSSRRPLCLSVDARLPLPDSIRSRLDALAARALRIGRRVVIPDHLPPFLEVRSSAAGPVLRVPLGDGREVLDLVTAAGGRIRFETDPKHDLFVGRRDLLLVRALMEGTELSWVPRDG